MKLIIIPKVHKVMCIIYAGKIMTMTTSRCCMVKNIDKIRSGIMFMKSIDKITSQLKRCRDLSFGGVVMLAQI